MSVPSVTGAGELVIWHELECGSYRADLALWIELAAHAQGSILDIGAGTGRVTLALTALGHDVVALEMETELAEALETSRSGSVEVVVADARDFRLDRRFALILVPMQTLQLFGGVAGRAGFWRCASAHLQPGGRVAAAIVTEIDPFDLEQGASDDMKADELVCAHRRYRSQPLAARIEPERFVLERRREVIAPPHPARSQLDVIGLDRVDPDALAVEARRVGLRPLGRRRIGATEEHVDSQVVIFGA
ncbi:MAG TPA: class I SAM-dependent methyltransferase [Solirubrobacteraceae bacterium]|jgi:SAM-dependent methyltransferase|nr:class I SAM-dependent methyltransferase [Solirubrobacteraceae bacterium]